MNTIYLKKFGVHEKARYLFYTVELENDMPAKLSSDLNIDDNVVRHLLVRVSR